MTTSRLGWFPILHRGDTYCLRGSSRVAGGDFIVAEGSGLGLQRSGKDLIDRDEPGQRLTGVSALPKIVNTESKRYELAEVTRRLIAEEGLEATTLRRIAERANCTTGLVTHYFATKEELLIAAMEQVRHAAQETRASLKEVNPGLPRLRECSPVAPPAGEEEQAGSSSLAI
jgi:hypothetical protein